jgi:hypothetical protein
MNIPVTRLYYGEITSYHYQKVGSDSIAVLHTEMNVCLQSYWVGVMSGRKRTEDNFKILRLRLRRYFRIEENKFAHAMQSYKESRGLAPCNLYNPGTSWSWVVKLTPQGFSPGKEAQ